MFYVVGTPIGNLKDVSFRALEVMKKVDLIACEDTRRTKILLSEYGINTQTTSYFQHNRVSKGQMILSLLQKGQDVALVSDAGMPGILDPGYNLINLVIQNNIPMTVIPGPTALISALVLSGKPAHRFLFEGFLPARTQARKNRLQELKLLKCTVVCYESCHRVEACLKDISEIFAEAPVCCSREISKKFEEVKRGSAAEILRSFGTGRPRGEFVLVF